MILDDTGEPWISVSQRLQTSLLDLSTERLIIFQNTSDPQNISVLWGLSTSKCEVFCLHLMNGEINLVSSENIGEKNLCLPSPWAGKEFAEDFSNLRLAKACYLSNLLTAVIFSFFRHQTERYHNVLGLQPCEREQRLDLFIPCLPQTTWQDFSTCPKTK